MLHVPQVPTSMIAIIFIMLFVHLRMCCVLDSMTWNFDWCITFLLQLPASMPETQWAQLSASITSILDGVNNASQ